MAAPCSPKRRKGARKKGRLLAAVGGLSIVGIVVVILIIMTIVYFASRT
jgi:hypothetical protein